MTKKNIKKNKREIKRENENYENENIVSIQQDYVDTTDTHILSEGVVISSIRGIIKAQLDSGQVIKAHLHGNMKMNKINVLVDDRVLLKISPYDMERGIVMRRLKNVS